MITLFAQHGVSDFEAWKRGADAARSNSDRSAQFGIVESSMYRMVDGSGVIVTHKFNDIEAAQKYKQTMESEETKSRLEQMGASLPITIWLAKNI